MASKKKHRNHRGGVPRGAAPFVMNRYTLRQVKWLFQCQAKVAYPDRRSARRACRDIYERTGDRLSAYHCRAGGNHYHVGHSRPRRLIMRELIEEWD